MKIIKPSFEIIDEPDALKKIELCGRVCYKSENRITDDSAETFVKNLIRRGHESVLEHAVFIVICEDTDANAFNRICSTIERRDGGRVLLKSTQKHSKIISGNARAWRDFMRECARINAYPKFLTLFNGVLFDDVNPAGHWVTTAEFIDRSQLTPDERDTHFTETVKFIVDRGISHEIVRHRMASFSQESTRYCNYAGDITFIAPPFACLEWVKSMEYAEKSYNEMTRKGLTPQECRSVLPNSAKTELIMTATRDNWKHFFDLRTAAAAHPQMREIAVPLRDEMERRWNDG